MFEIDKLTYYGFRGEALSSICAVADVTVITKSESDLYARSFAMDNNGHVINSLISHHQKGWYIIFFIGYGFMQIYHYTDEYYNAQINFSLLTSSFSSARC